MTARNKLQPGQCHQMDAVVRYILSAPDDRNHCICCPDEPSHVFCYDATPTSEYQDLHTWMNDMVRRSPNGSLVRISFEVVSV